MTDHHGIERRHHLDSTLNRHRTRRWALGSLVAAVAAGSSLGGAAAQDDLPDDLPNAVPNPDDHHAGLTQQAQDAAARRFREAAQRQIDELNDISTNINQQGVQYETPPEE